MDEKLQFKLLKDDTYEITAKAWFEKGGEFVIPEVYNGKAVTSIGNGAFQYHGNQLTSIVISNGVKNIGENAFSSCHALKSIVIPEGVTNIGKNAFTLCQSLKKLVFPKSVVFIGENVLGWCNNLTSITVEKDNKKYKSEGNCLIRKSDNALIAGCKKSIIPDCVTSIEKFSFYNIAFNGRLPDSIITIKSKAFYSSKIKEIIIPVNVLTIEREAFYDLKKSVINIEGHEKKPNGWDEYWEFANNSVTINWGT